MIRKYLDVLRHENFDKNAGKISRENQTGIELLLLFESVILLFNVLGDVIGGRDVLNMHSLDAQVVFICLALVIYVFVLRKRATNYTFWIYALETPLLLATMFVGILGEPNELTFTFLFYLLLFPLLILDKPWRVSLFIVVMAAIYAVSAIFFKSPAVLPKDLIHVINVTLMSIAASIYFLVVRIRNIEFAGFFAQKADEDPLTGLYNRSGARHHIDPAKPCILVYLDLDKFKGINDRFGHDAGDQVIMDTAEVLRESFRSSDTIARLGGDEFAIYASGSWTHEDVGRKLADLLARIRDMESARDATGERQVTASIGCALAPHGSESLHQLINVADRAMYQAKKAGKDGYSIVAV